FQQLEGTAGTVPAPQNQGAVIGAVPTDPATTAALPDEPMDDLGGPMHEPLAPMDDLGPPIDDIGESADPRVGSNSTGVGVLGANNPLDLSLDGGAQISNGDAQAQYQ